MFYKEPEKDADPSPWGQFNPPESEVHEGGTNGKKGLNFLRRFLKKEAEAGVKRVIHAKTEALKKRFPRLAGVNLEAGAEAMLAQLKDFTSSEQVAAFLKEQTAQLGGAGGSVSSVQAGVADDIWGQVGSAETANYNGSSASESKNAMSGTQWERLIKIAVLTVVILAIAALASGTGGLPLVFAVPVEAALIKALVTLLLREGPGPIQGDVNPDDIFRELQFAGVSN